MRKKAFNDRRTKAMKLAINKVKNLIKDKKAKEAKEALNKAYQAIDKAAKMKVIEKNNAARKKSLLSRLVKGVK